MILAAFFGFGIGMAVGRSNPPPVWKQNLAFKIRATATYKFMTFQGKTWEDWFDRFHQWADRVEKDIEMEEYDQNPAHPRVFAVLRESVVGEAGGYVHPDLGLLVPAPCGAARGLGMLRDSFQQCQTRCLPGTAKEKREEHLLEMENHTLPFPPEQTYQQEEVLVRVPLKVQMTRKVALDTLLSIIPADVQKKASLHELDDAALLVLLLAHERGIGRNSRWVTYIAMMPPQPSCGYAEELRPYMMDAINAYREEIGIDAQGWNTEIIKATNYAEQIAEGLTSDYGDYLSRPERVSPLDNIKWALCQVASRATAGNEKHGALRLVPVIDLVNHDATAGGFMELTGKERIRNGDFVDASEEDSGTFVLRSLRHGRRRPLKKGQELLANYNVPHYSALDWFLSLGFVPRERWGRWQKIEPVLPRVRSDGPFAKATKPTAEIWKEKGPALIDELRSAEL